MKKIILIFMTVLIIVSSTLPICAADNKYSVDLDETKVADDLSKIYKDLSGFYVDSTDTEIHFITLAESGVSSKGPTADYALYFYFHNPSLKKVTSSDYNKIQLSCGWDIDGNPVEYKKYPLELLSVSPDMRFIKCKLAAPTDSVYMTGTSRKYAVSGVELVGIDTDSFKSEDYSICRSFEFSGYEGDLLCKCYDLLTITLDVYQTSYLSGDSAKPIDSKNNGAYSNQINSVWFSIPEKIINQYGNLYAVDYEFYHYRTAPMLVVDDETAFDILISDIGKKHIDCEWGYSVSDIVQYTADAHTTSTYMGHSFGDKFDDTLLSFYYYDGYPEIGTYHDYFTTVFFAEDVTERDRVLVSADTVQQYFENYNASQHSGFSPVGSKNYSSDLFDLEKSLGYKRFYRTIDEKFSLNSYKDSENNNFLKHLFNGKWHYVFDINSYDNSLSNVPFIEEVKKSSFSLSDSKTSENLYISVDDVDELRKFVDTSCNDDKRTYLLRYAYSDDYYSIELDTSGELEDCNVLMAQENVYLDFDIITLSFRDENVISVIPVVSNPTDGFTGIQNTDSEAYSPKNSNWLKILLGIALGCLALFVAFTVLKTFLKNKTRMPDRRSNHKYHKRGNYKYKKKRYKRRRYK